MKFIRLLASVPLMIIEVLTFAKWLVTQQLNTEPTETDEALSPVAAARIALELVGVIRTSSDDPAAFNRGMNAAFDGLDAEEMIDVALALAGMVAVMADDEAMAFFGQNVLRLEAL